MISIGRRHALALVGLGLAGTLAGCLDDGTPDTSPTDDPDSPTATDGGRIAVETIRFRTRSSAPDWYHHDDARTGRLVAIDSRERARAALPLADLSPERRDAVQEFLGATDFAAAVVLFVETVGPNTCYDTVAVSDVRLAGGELRGSATATDTSDADEACGDAVTFPSVLVRATVDGDPPDTATVTITDGWGNSVPVTARTTDSLSSPPGELPGHVRPDGDPATIPAPLTCDREGFERHGRDLSGDAVAWGETIDEDGTPTLALRVDRLQASYGESVRIAMTNVSDAVQSTGNRHKYSIEVYTEAGWQDLRGTTDGRPLGYTDEAISHQPGEGFEWSIELTESGLLDGHVHEEALVVCPDLPAGRYRFVFWEPAVAVAFDLRR